MPDAGWIGGGAAASLAGVFLFVMEWRSRRQHAAWCAAAEQAEGTVSRIALRHRPSRNAPTFDDAGTATPVVRFRASDGVGYQFDAPGSFLKEGATVRVAYRPEMPSDARLVDPPRKVGCMIVLLAGGLAAIVYGYLFL